MKYLVLVTHEDAVIGSRVYDDAIPAGLAFASAVSYLYDHLDIVIPKRLHDFAYDPDATAQVAKYIEAQSSYSVKLLTVHDQKAVVKWPGFFYDYEGVSNA